MLLSTKDILLFLLLGGIVQLIGVFAGKIHKKFGYAMEIAAAILAAGYAFYQHSFPDGFIYIGFLSISYSAFMVLTQGKDKYNEVQAELKNLNVEEIELQRDRKRIIIDFLVVAIVFLGAILFLIYGPISPLKYFIIFGLVAALTELSKRFFAYISVKVYYSKFEETIYIASRLASRKFPIADIKKIQLESTVDLLKLHPLLTLFTSNSDFTTSFYKVLRFSLPGETLYLTAKEPEKWKEIFEMGQTVEENTKEVLKVLPFYHKKNVKRLLGKLYFAMTVKGVSAYTGLLLLLYYLEVPTWLLVGIGVLYWVVNLYYSDRVLKVAMDAKETTDPKLIEVSRRIFEKAGIPNVKVYVTESSEYNGLATGMNIGRAMVTLTTATLKLPVEAIEGIVAHEAIHVKKRDVMWGQLWRFGFLFAVLAIIFFIIDHFSNLDEYTIPIMIFIWLLIVLFPIYQSFCAQWMEVRADHLAASLLEGGNRQMAESLTALAKAQDEAFKKSAEYSTVVTEKEREDRSSLKRGPLFIRLIEFQFMPHPPMYWRIQTLHGNQFGWGKGMLRRWLADRVRESVTR